MKKLNIKQVLTAWVVALPLTMFAMTANAQSTDGGSDINGDPVASIDPGTADGTGIENLVTVTGSYDGTDYENDAFEEVLVVAADPGITVTKVADITADAEVGDLVTYTYTITNTGNVTLDGVTIDDQHTNAAGTSALAVGSCSVTGLGTNANDTVIDAATLPSETLTTFGAMDVVTCEATYTVTQADVDGLQ